MFGGRSYIQLITLSIESNYNCSNNWLKEHMFGGRSYIHIGAGGPLIFGSW